MQALAPEYRFWVEETLDCIKRAHTEYSDQRGPFLTARALGMALVALRDAHARAKGIPAFLDQLDNHSSVPPLAGSNHKIVAAAACAQLLRKRYSDQGSLIDSAFSEWKEKFQLGIVPEFDSNERYGRAFGDAINDLGRADRGIANVQYSPVNAPYSHRAPPNEPDQSFAGAAWGSAIPLAASRRSGMAIIRNFPRPPGRISATQVEGSDHYRGDYEKVVDKGISNRNSGGRSEEEEIIGIYWGYDGSKNIGTPPRLYLQVALSILDDINKKTENILSNDEELDVVTMIGLSQADAGIDAWYYKYSLDHMMWRPALGIPNAIPEHGTSPKPNWRPLGRPATNGEASEVELTPDFPAYPSGHATFGAAAFQLLRLFLVSRGVARFTHNGIDNISFDFISDEYNGKNKDPRTGEIRPETPRFHESLWKAIVDNSISRVFLGVHWEFDGITTRKGSRDCFGVPNSPNKLGHTGGVWLGVQIANLLAEKKLGISKEIIKQSMGRY